MICMTLDHVASLVHPPNGFSSILTVLTLLVFCIYFMQVSLCTVVPYWKLLKLSFVQVLTFGSAMLRAKLMFRLICYYVCYCKNISCDSLKPHQLILSPHGSCYQHNGEGAFKSFGWGQDFTSLFPSYGPE